MGVQPDKSAALKIVLGVLVVGSLARISTMLSSTQVETSSLINPFSSHHKEVNTSLSYQSGISFFLNVIVYKI